MTKYLWVVYNFFFLFFFWLCWFRYPVQTLGRSQSGKGQAEKERKAFHTLPSAEHSHVRPSVGFFDYRRRENPTEHPDPHLPSQKGGFGRPADVWTCNPTNGDARNTNACWKIRDKCAQLWANLDQPPEQEKKKKKNLHCWTRTGSPATWYVLVAQK